VGLSEALAYTSAAGPRWTAAAALTLRSPTRRPQANSQTFG
jgi:hypothetical protein